jgi:predicted phosphodiesterase
MAKLNLNDIRGRAENAVVNEDQLVKILKERNGISIDEVASIIGVPLVSVFRKIEHLRSKNIMIAEGDGLYFIKESAEQGKKFTLDPKLWQGDTLKIGHVSDNHLGSNFERLDVLNCLYDLFEDEGVSVVFHTGNLVEGEASFNRNEIKIWGFDNQVDYAVRNFPYKKGFKTKMITADDHEGWWSQRMGVNFGRHFVAQREAAGMFDFEDAGYMEADFNLNDGIHEHPLWLRGMHPGGGTAYAISYKAQKIVESFQPGEKPQVLLLGHFHKQDFIPIRGVFVNQCGTTSDQSIYMRKKNIAAQVGGSILELTVNKYGILPRVKGEHITFFDKGFYLGNDKYLKRF